MGCLARHAVAAALGGALCASLLGAGTASAAPLAPQSSARAGTDAVPGTLDSTLDSLTARLERHLVERGGALVFDEQKAGAAGEAANVLEAGAGFNYLMRETGSTPVAARFAMLFGLPVWGNWCGPRHSGPGAPLDTLDRLCMEHDECYRDQGRFDCECDARLTSQIRRLFTQMTPKERAMAAAIAVYFHVVPCKP